MGRRRIGEKPYSIVDNKGTATLRATIAGYRIKVSLGVPWATDRRSAGKIDALAAKEFADLVARRVITHDPRVRTSHTLEELIAMWLVHVEGRRPRSYRMFEDHARVLLRYGRSLAELCGDTGPQEFADARLGQVVRKTVRKEVCSMFGLLEWAQKQGYLASNPPRPKLPRGEAGKRSGPQREHAVDASPGEIAAFLAAIPEWSTSKNGEPFRVRDALAFAYETGLRPSTVARLEVPIHWAKGRTMLTVTADIDKASYAREVPLSPGALAILQRCAKTSGPVFGRHDYRVHIKRAAALVFDAERARRFAAYDLRHARTTHILAASNDLVGTAYLVGHRQVTTTNRYVHAARGHAERALASLAQLGPQSAPSQKRPSEKKGKNSG